MLQTKRKTLVGTAVDSEVFEMPRICVSFAPNPPPVAKTVAGGLLQFASNGRNGD